VKRITRYFNTKEKSFKTTEETSYYLSSAIISASTATIAIREHWGIENRNHYVRDATLQEDASRIRVNPGIFARLRSFSLNILRKNEVKNVSKALYENALNFDNILKYQYVF
jgi:predicted transposase YbfD/YdcC